MIAENIMQDRPVDTRKAANFLGVTEAFMIQRRHRGQPPEFLRIGRAVRYLPSTLAAYREECLVRPTNNPEPAMRAVPAGGVITPATRA